jgi:hypothetical protein
LSTDEGEEAHNFVSYGDKCKRHKIEYIWVKMGFDCTFVVEPIGRSGGLALCWNDADMLEIQNFSRRHINAIVKNGDSIGK